MPSNTSSPPELQQRAAGDGQGNLGHDPRDLGEGVRQGLAVVLSLLATWLLSSRWEEETSSSPTPFFVAASHVVLDALSPGEASPLLHAPAPC